MTDVARITFDCVVAVYFHTHFLQFVLELNNGRNVRVVCDDNAAYMKTAFRKYTDETEHVHIICDTKVVAYFVFCNISCVDRDDNLCLIGKLHQHTQFAVRFKPRENSGGMIIIKQLSSEFQV